MDTAFKLVRIKSILLIESRLTEGIVRLKYEVVMKLNQNIRLVNNTKTTHCPLWLRSYSIWVRNCD